MRELNSLLKPKSVAVVGASRDRKKLGRLVLDNVLAGGFRGKVYPVNPKANKIGSLKCYHSLKEIPGNVDLAVISIPAKFVKDTLQDCCDKGVRSVAVISAGFSETGQEGFEEEYKLKLKAEGCKLTVLGPNCLGVISSYVNLNATFAKNSVKKGSIAFLSQSGALGTAALDWAEKSGVGFSHFISLGNKMDLSENDFLEYLDKDKIVKAIAYYLEDFVDGREFIKLASKISKPILILKPGKSEAAQKALGSHTGSLAQDDLIISSAIAQAGALRIRTIEELFNVMKLISSGDILAGKNIAIVTNAGGPGVFTTDAVEASGLKLSELSSRTQQELALKLPAAACVKNPVDVLGDALSDRYKFAIEHVIRDKNVDGVIVILTPQVMTEIEKTAEIIVNIDKKSKKFIIPTFIGGKEVERGNKIFQKNGVCYFSYPEDAVRALAYLNGGRHKAPDYANATSGKQGKKRKAKQITADRKQRSKVAGLLKGRKDAIETQVAERILKAYKIPVLESDFVEDIAGARRAVKKFGYPVVMKLASEGLLHKTELKAVRVGIGDQNELEQNLNELANIANSQKLTDFKIQIQPQIKGALELIIGVKKDPDQYGEVEGKEILINKGFGHSIIFGMGGIYTEVYKDISLGITPLTEEYIDKMISETKVSEILTGARGQKYNIKKIKEVIFQLSQLVTDFPQIAELDINPLFAKGKEVWVVDAKMLIDGN
jgi:acetyl coenzyme A synthetase (ADP forming)-like protein